MLDAFPCGAIEAVDVAGGDDPEYFAYGLGEERTAMGLSAVCWWRGQTRQARLKTPEIAGVRIVLPQAAGSDTGGHHQLIAIGGDVVEQVQAPVTRNWIEPAGTAAVQQYTLAAADSDIIGGLDVDARQRSLGERHLEFFERLAVPVAEHRFRSGR